MRNTLNTIFISYSRKNKEWTKRFVDALRPGVIQKKYNIWSDQQIPPSEKWGPEIDKMISSATAALLLVTPEFLESTYIIDKELPRILDRWGNKCLDLFWVPVKSVMSSHLADTGLHEIEAAWTEDPLAKLDDAECQKAIEAISDKLIRCVTEDVRDKTRRELKKELGGALGSDVVIGDELALGDFSIMYKAKRKKTPVVVKAALPSIRHDWIADDFKSRADWFQQFGEAPFVNIIEAVRVDQLSCAIMEYVPLPTLREVTGLKPKQVANVLAQVAQAADKLHRKTLKNSPTVHLIGPLRPGHIFHNPNDGEIRISPLNISNATLLSCDSRPLLKLSENELTSLVPERYAGERSRFETDQYYIGLLGLELLTGEPPVKVDCYADLIKKEAFFEAPMAKFQKYRETSPELLFVLARMLERQPESRWKTMEDIYDSFYRIAQGKLPTALRNKAIATYEELELNHPTFYDDFYENFFRRSPGARAFFKQTKWDLQRQKLKEAADVLLHFRPEDFRNPSMSAYTKRHQMLGIQSEYFFAFREAFIDTLNSAKVDDYGVDAWRAILNAGIVYMTNSSERPPVRRVQRGAAALKTPARPRSKPDARRRGRDK